MSDIAQTDLCREPRISIQHGHSTDHVQESTQHVQQHAQAMLKALNERANALAAAAEFKAALDDANAMTRIAPSSALGYLCMGHVYAQQGLFLAAVDVYDRGLNAISDLRDSSGYRQLQQAKAVAQAACRTRIDFIDQLPLDIVVTNIVPRVMSAPVNLCAPHPCLYVSHAWRSRMILSGGLETIADSKDMHSAAVEFAPYARSLALIGRECIEASTPMLRQAKFESLTRLVLAPSYFDPRTEGAKPWVANPNAFPARPYLNVLRCIGDRLTELSIKFDLNVCIHLRQILDACPNLRSLDSSGVGAELSPTELPTYVELTSLKLNDAVVSATYDQMMDILKHFPSLLELSVFPCIGASLMAHALMYCPRLQLLRYGSSRPLRWTIVDPVIDAVQLQTERQQEGLRALEVDGNASYNSTELYLLMTRHCRTLEACRIEGQCTDDATYLDKSDVEFERLKGLALWYTSDTCGPLSVWILRHAPHLETVDFGFHAISAEVADAVITLTKLRTLEIGYRLPSDDGNDTVRQRLFQHHVQLGSQSSLRSLTVHVARFMTGSSAGWISTVARLNYLRVLSITVDGGIYGDFHPCIEQLAHGCPALEKLILDGNGHSFSDGTLFPLRNHGRIRHIVLTAHVLSFSDLLSLVAGPCNLALSRLDLALTEKPPEESVMQPLKHHIPNVSWRPLRSSQHHVL